MIKLPTSNRFQYVATLPEETQQTIKREVTRALKKDECYNQENIENAMNSKVVDLEDTITIKYI